MRGRETWEIVKLRIVKPLINNGFVLYRKG